MGITVSVASIDNLDDLATSLRLCCQGTQEVVQDTVGALERLSDSSASALAAALQALELAQQEVARLESRIDSLETQLTFNGLRDQADAASEHSAAGDELQDAKEWLAKCEERCEKVAEISRKVEILRGRFIDRSRTSMARLTEFQEECVARLNRACSALESYIADKPDSSTAAFYRWIRWSPAEGELVSPAMLAERLRLSPEQLREIVAYESERDPRFRAKIEEYGRRYAATRSLDERKAILRQARINGSGEISERIVAAAFRPLGDVSTQGRTHFDDGRYTKTDLTVNNLCAPVLLGKGDRAFAPKGGSLALEVKAGQYAYLQQQADHLVFQAGGHRTADASATICTADIHDLPKDEERSLRDRVRTAGSPMIGMLPRKHDIDHAIFEAIAYGFGNGRGTA